jgi:hypothetical protein
MMKNTVFLNIVCRGNEEDAQITGWLRNSSSLSFNCKSLAFVIWSLESIFNLLKRASIKAVASDTLSKPDLYLESIPYSTSIIRSLSSVIVVKIY